MLTQMQRLWREPRPIAPAGIPWWDVALFAAFVSASALEVFVRDDVHWPLPVLLFQLILLLTLLWRRSHAFASFMIAFGALHTIALLTLIAGVTLTDLGTSSFVLLLVYSLFRWGAGREAAAGLVLIVIGYTLSALNGEMKNVEEAIGGGVIVLFPVFIGASVRFWTNAQQRELEQVKLNERATLARELHDTVAHHISAIAISAQAGKAVAKNRPLAALEALDVIEDEAAKTLSDLRSLVSALRDDESAALAPQPDLSALAQSFGDDHQIEVLLLGNLKDLSPQLERTLYRLAQESITNAVRHAKNASQITVRIEGKTDVVHLQVTDDGAAQRFSSSAGDGYGLIGMAERVALLAGTFKAGADPVGGWRVEAQLPKCPETQ